MSDLAQLQHEFMTYIRQAELGQPPQGTDARHMAVYRELFFNNVSGFVSSAYPVLKSLHSEQRWQQRVRDFFAHYDCHSPLFVEISKSFLDYLEHLTEPDFPYEAQLAQYEYLELWVDIQIEPDDQVQINQLSPELPLQRYRASALGSYDYPVHCIRRDFATPEPEPTFIVIYRQHSSQVSFSQLNPMLMQLLLEIDEQPNITLIALTEKMQPLLPQLPIEQLSQAVWQSVQQLAERGIVKTLKTG